MSDFKPKPGSFAPYLEYMQRDKKAEPSTSQASPLTLLEVLARQVQQALPMPDLQTLSGMEPARYREALKSLVSSGYISIEGPALEEIVKLTAKGEDVARLARPA